MDPALRLAPTGPSLNSDTIGAGSLLRGVDNGSHRYERLALVDRTHARSLARTCRVNSDSINVSRVLTTQSLLQTLLTSAPLVVADFFTLWMLLFGSTAIIERLFGLPIGLVTRQTSLLASLLLPPIVQLAGLYPAMGTSPAVEFRQLVRSASTALCIFAGIGIMHDSSKWLFFVTSALLTIVLAVPILPASRFVARAVGRRCPWWGAPALIYANSASIGGDLFRRIRATEERGLRPVGVLLDIDNYWDAASELDDLGIPSHPIDDILDVAAKNHATWVLVAHSSASTPDRAWAEENETHMALRAIPNRVYLSSLSGFECGMWDRTHTVGNSAGLLMANSQHCDSTQFVKRFLDFTFTALICLLASPLLVAITIAIRLSSKGPVFYGQRRIGRGGTEFTAWKFRTMVPDAERILSRYLAENPEFQREWHETHKLKNDPRITWIGKVLRKTSLDELPQLWNILKGEMSLVGPRPIVDSPQYDAAYIHDYQREFAVYKSVRPGLTGMWQVTCRNSGVYEMRIYWDMYYVRNWSLWLDLYIILRTVRTVLLREGAA